MCRELFAVLYAIQCRMNIYTHGQNTKTSGISETLTGIGTMVWSETPPRGSVANDDVIMDLIIPDGIWIVSGYAGGAKISLENTDRSIIRMGINPTIVNGGNIVIRAVNKSGASITRYDDGTNYYIMAARIK